MREEQESKNQQRVIDPAVRGFYEENPYDPLAAARMLGKFLGAVVSFDRKMNPLIVGGSVILGLGMLIPAMISGNVFGITFGAAILLNVFRNLRRFYRWPSLA